MGKPMKSKGITTPIEELSYEELIEIIKGKGKKLRKEDAYLILQKRVSLKISFVVRQFYIPGLTSEDILQEALYALRFKAIPDYDRTKGRDGEIYPFDKFAVLCIRRHLSTILKGSFQNKKKTLNTSLSLDQDRGSGGEESLYLADILPKTDGTVADELSEQEYYKDIFSSLLKGLSVLEQQVFVLYANKYSYDEISDIINLYYKRRENGKKTNVKSIDNALSRIKQKAQEIYQRIQDKEKENE